jgi:hypothetical protein
MHTPGRWIFSGILALAAWMTVSIPAFAKTSSWPDAQGASFRGEPVEILGPFVLFRTGGNNGRRLLLRGFSPEDCRRIEAEIALRPPRASTLAEAKGDATSELVGNVLQLRGKTLVPADLSHLVEPALVLVLCGSHNDGESWAMAGNLQALDRRVDRVFPGLVATLFMGARHNEAEHRAMAVESGMPWLIADFSHERTMHSLNRCIPAEGTNMVLVSREGVPLLAAQATDVNAMRLFEDQVSELLWQINPANPGGWKDRLHYLAATRTREFASSHAEPLLVGNPLRADGLRQYGVKRIAAHLEIAADGKVTPTLLSGPDDVPPQLAQPLTGALRQTVVAPAIDHGAAVAGTLEYLLDVPPVNKQAEADAAWLGSSTYPVLPIDQWLVLRPIKVPEQDFTSSIEGETASGTVLFKAIEVSDAKVSRAAQMSAFNTDWFTAAGADSVRPKEGDKQRIDETTELTWQRVKAKDGFVNMQTGLTKLDYTVGYAWTEFEVPADVIGWLGIGSDDGVKIWLNGELVHDKWIRRISRIDDDVVPLRLKKGPNRILIKIQNATIDWSFIYRVRVKPN